MKLDMARLDVDALLAEPLPQPVARRAEPFFRTVDEALLWARLTERGLTCADADTVILRWREDGGKDVTHG